MTSPVEQPQPLLFEDPTTGSRESAARESAARESAARELAARAVAEQAPFRIELRTATLEELAHANQLKGHKGARAYLEGYDAASMARNAQSAVKARFASWIFHPDERVPIALTENRTDPPIWKAEIHRAYVTDSLFQHAIQRADAEGVIWTPLLDALAVRPLWAAGRRPTWDDSGPLRTWGVSPEECPATVDYESPVDRVARLEPWISRQASARTVEPLLAFDYPPLLKLVARTTPFPDAAFVKAVLTQPFLGPSLAANPHLSPDLVVLVAWWATERISPPSAGERLRSWPRHEADASPYRPNREGSTADSAGGIAAQTIASLKAAQHTLPEAVRDALVRALVASPTRVSATRAAWSPQVHRSWTTPNPRAAADALLALGTETDETTLLQIVAHMGSNLDFARAAALHPSATTAVRLAALKANHAISLRVAMAEHPPALADSAVRATFAKSSASDILLALCADATEPEWRKYFGRLLAKAPDVAVSALERSPSHLGRLSADDLAPLLAGTPTLALRVVDLLRGRTLQAQGAGRGVDGSALFRDQLPRIFARLVASEARLAYRLLTDRKDLVAEGLRPADIAPLLASEDQQLRLAAVLAMGDIPDTVVDGPTRVWQHAVS
jgi:hypothetical protein